MMTAAHIAILIALLGIASAFIFPVFLTGGTSRNAASFLIIFAPKMEDQADLEVGAAGRSVWITRLRKHGL